MKPIEYTTQPNTARVLVADKHQAKLEELSKVRNKIEIAQETVNSLQMREGILLAELDNLSSALEVLA